MSVRHLLSRVYRDNHVTERLPITPTVGVSWPLTARATAAGDVTWNEGTGGPARISVGGEYWVLTERLAGRAGVRRYGAGLEDRTVPCFGAGIRWRRIDLDYSFTADDDGPGSTHRFGVNVVLSRPD